jgi:transposase
MRSEISGRASTPYANGAYGALTVYLAAGVTDMRKGITGLAALAQRELRQNPASGAVFAFRGRRGDRLKLLYWDGQGFCLYYKVLEHGRFPLAIARGRQRAADLRAARDAVGGDRLAPAGMDRAAGARGLIHPLESG